MRATPGGAQVAKRQNYGFQKQQQDLKKQKKREEKEAKKRQKSEAAEGGPQPADPSNEDA